MAAVLRAAGHEVQLIDANAENLNYEEIKNAITHKTDVVVFRFTPTTFLQDLQTAAIAKQISESIITIGLCWTLRTYVHDVMAKAPDLDIYILNDDFSSISGVLTAIYNKTLKDVAGIAYREQGNVVVTPSSSKRIDFDALPMPAYDLIEPGNYYNNTPRKIRFMAIYTSKGCPNGCIYCTVRRTGWRAKSSSRVVEEIRYLVKEQNVQEIAFFDEVFTYDRKRVEEICSQLIEQGISVRWYCNVTADTVDKDLLILMKKAGCSGFSLGVESGSPGILSACGKANTVEQAYNAIQQGKLCGLKVYTSFIVGLPGETWDTVMDTAAFLKRALPHGAQVNIAVPYPGTKLYETASENGWIEGTFTWESLFQHDAAMYLPSISQAELYKARQLLYRSLYLNPTWVWQNIKYVIKNPDDLSFAVRYYFKSMTNLVLHKMRHAH
jgi:radical SAM superfamily enzyme YgiQ (UPF0313 family)